MTKKMKNTTKTKDGIKPSKVTTAPPSMTATERPEKDAPVDPDENLKWMTTGRLVLAVVTVIGALAVRGWLSLRRAGNLPGPGPVQRPA